MPPLMDERRTSRLMDSWTKSKLSGTRGDPVERIASSFVRLWVRAGASPAFLTASMYLAEVPNVSMPSPATKSKSVFPSG